MGLEVIRPGLLSLIQDLGRMGHSEKGVSQGGPMDLHAHAWANHLLGNDPGAAVLEVSIGQAEFRVRTPLTISLTGASMNAKVNGQGIGSWRSLTLKRDDRLILDPASSGMRGYLGISGGVDAPVQLGSRSTVLRNRLGKVLQKGEILESEGRPVSGTNYIPPQFIPDYEQPCILNVIQGFQEASFDQTLFENAYQLLPQSDRMGARFSGPPVECEMTGMLSEGIPLGAIQIPPDGQPVILLNDRQTLGGYPKIGCVARVDLPKIGQLRPGAEVRFETIEPEEARRKWRGFTGFFGLD